MSRDFLFVTLLVILIGCSSYPTKNETSRSQANSSEMVRSPSRSSFHMEVLFPPTPVPVADTTRLVYELHLTNFSRDKLRLTSVQVIDNESGQIIADYQGTALEALLGRPGPDLPAKERLTVVPGNRAITYFNLPVDATRAPSALRHRVEFAVMTNEGSKQAAVEGSVIEVKEVHLPELGPPLRGGPWVAVHSPSWKQGHRRVFYAVGGQARIQGRFAIDWMKASVQNLSTAGNKEQATSAYGLGADVLAVADAMVVAVRDSIPEPEDCAAHKPLTMEEYAGNYVVLKFGEGRYAFYEHLQPDVSVQPGDRLRRGQVIGSLGCTGQATRPHLHFHVGDTRSSFSEGLPYLLTGANVMGVYGSFDDFRAGATWRELSLDNGTLPSAFFPAPLMVVRFAEE